MSIYLLFGFPPVGQRVLRASASSKQAGWASLLSLWQIAFDQVILPGTGRWTMSLDDALSFAQLQCRMDIPLRVYATLYLQ